ncbi:MBL fold metallo-hydrolase [Aliidiomarina quisquiliarum]|uniref:MBL fold metallo-hydrolase n=1 Tax=Aliidiomarina quisquiliarum TaxID=2938947 RepID=UPI00208EA03E|nr:MBL fold metallo-hydrolase [Aliidiomarina quisquiliarum]MCO4320504.1 MBL fold metallo-hydrolase [Aliidiomarina quisquiliarum]
MKVVFLGGTETVTGSKYLVETATTRVLVDCGLFQGYKWLRRRNWQPLPLGIQDVDAVLLTHAHLDHSGFIPVLYRHGFRGPVYTHPATAALCSILWPDSGKIQEEDAKYYAKYKLSRHEEPQALYDARIATEALELLKPVEFHKTFKVGDLTVEFHPVGHILGAASIIIDDGNHRVCFSGDVGRFNDILMHDPEPLPNVDTLLLESTYGDRLHTTEDPFEQLEEVVNETMKSGGVLLIPSFSVGRAQVLQHMLVKLMDSKRIPRVPMFLDSPMAINVSDIYSEFHHYHKLTAAECARSQQLIQYTHSVDDSKAIAEQIGPHIIIAGSGMATGGRILHHFKHWLSDHRTTVLFTGHQAGGTRGAKMQQGVSAIKVHGEWLPLKAQVRVLDGLSGHADYKDLHSWLAKSKLSPNTNIQLVHGEPNALEALRDYLLQHTSFDVDIPAYMSILHLNNMDEPAAS